MKQIIVAIIGFFLLAFVILKISSDREISQLQYDIKRLQRDAQKQQEIIEYTIAAKEKAEKAAQSEYENTKRALQNTKCADYNVPGNVSDQLYEYAGRIRKNAISGSSSR